MSEDNEDTQCKGCGLWMTAEQAKTHECSEIPPVPVDRAPTVSIEVTPVDELESVRAECRELVADRDRMADALDRAVMLKRQAEAQCDRFRKMALRKTGAGDLWDSLFLLCFQELQDRTLVSDAIPAEMQGTALVRAACKTADELMAAVKEYRGDVSTSD